MSRRASVVPLVTWRPAAAQDFAAKGLPLMEVWEAVFRLVWSAPTYSQKSNQNRRRTMELCRALPPHPTPADVMAWLVALRSQFTGETPDHHRKNLAAAYAYGAKLGVSSGNPAALLPKERRTGRPAPILNIDQAWPALLGACKDDRERAMLGVFRFTGLRRGEVLGLRFDDVNTYADPWRLEVVRQRPDPNRIDHTPPKTPTSARELPVRGPLRELLAPVVAVGEHEVRCGLGGGGRRRTMLLFPYNGDHLSDMMKRLRQVAPPDAFPEGHKAWHALRDTLAVEMRRKGKTRSQISEALGHSSEGVTSLHYLSIFGRSVHADAFSGLDDARGPVTPRAGAPPGVTPAAESGTAAASTAAVPRRSKQGSPTVRKENTACRTPSQKRDPRAGAAPTSAPVATVATNTTPAARSAGSSNARASRSGSPVQRSLPRLAAGPLTRRPRPPGR